MKRNLLSLLATLCLLPALATAEPVAPKNAAPATSADLTLAAASVTYLPELDLLVFEQRVLGTAGGVSLRPNGALNGAPVLGHVFPTTLKPQDVGFGASEGIVALAVTIHPDFDDTPLWDENNNRKYDDDGAIFHTHWVVLVPDQRVAGGLSVKEIKMEEMATLLPPTHCGMHMLMDAPGFSVLKKGAGIKVLVPAQRVNHRTDFKFDAVTAYMEVATDPGKPMLGVHKVYSVLSKDLSLPYTVTRP